MNGYTEIIVEGNVKIPLRFSIAAMEMFKTKNAGLDRNELGASTDIFYVAHMLRAAYVTLCYYEERPIVFPLATFVDWVEVNRNNQEEFQRVVKIMQDSMNLRNPEPPKPEEITTVKKKRTGTKLKPSV